MRGDNGKAIVKQPWRLIGFEHPDGSFYEYLTNDLCLEPGVVAFLYLRRWDEEKLFDDIKTILPDPRPGVRVRCPLASKRYYQWLASF